MAKFCPNCNKELADNAKFCIGCGTPIPVEPVEPVAPVTPVIEPTVPVAPVVEPVTPSVDKPKKNKKGLIIAIVAVIVAIALIVTGIIVVPKLFGDDKKSTSGKDAKETTTHAKVEEELPPEVQMINYISKQRSIEYDSDGSIRWEQSYEYSAPNMLTLYETSSYYENGGKLVVEYDSNGKLIKYDLDSDEEGRDISIAFDYTEKDGKYVASSSYTLKEVRWYEDYYYGWTSEEIYVAYNITLSYDKNGVDGECEISTDYNDQTRKLKVSDEGKTITYNYEDTDFYSNYTYSYDDNGNILSIVSDSTYGESVTNYKYDSDGNLTREENLNNGTLIYEYDYEYSDGKLVKRKFASYDDEYMGREKTTTTYTYNSDGLLTGVEQITDGIVVYKEVAKTIKEDSVETEMYYYYDGEQFAGIAEYQYEGDVLKSVTRHNENGEITGLIEYDSLGRITKSVEYTYVYDDYGDIIGTTKYYEEIYEYSEVEGTKNYPCFDYIGRYFSN